MKRTIVNAALLVLLALVLSLNWVLRANPAERNIEILPDMARSASWKSFSESPIFADGMTMHAPVPGTVIHGELPLHYAASVPDAERAGRELVNPFRATDAAAVARGSYVFTNFCIECHGQHGTGDGIVAQRGFPMPKSLVALNARQLPDGRIFHVITYGQGNMPAHAAQIAPEDRWKAVLYVRQLQAQTKG